MTLELLCKVVDNYGDIGFVYRLARALSETEAGLRLRLHVDDLQAFASLRPGLEPSAPVQELLGWELVDWNIEVAELEKTCARGAPPSLVIECFACGRPPALEELLFDPSRTDTRLIVNLEHLTAEAWADELHRMPSATRSALVKKVIFMPGFTPATGGLLIDGGFRAAAARWKSPGSAPPSQPPVPKATGPVPSATNTVPQWTETPPPPPPPQSDGQSTRAALRRELALRAGIDLGPGDEERPWVLVFSYERDYRRIVADLASWTPSKTMPSSALALVAAGRSAPAFFEAWRAEGETFPALALPFLPQEIWDEFILAADLAIVRGEESLARAALSGRPFLWHAYRQDNNHQLVKVRALLDRMRPAFADSPAAAGAFAAYEALSLAFNERLADGPEAGGDEDFLPVLEALPSLEAGFAAFAQGLFANGDLAARLLAFIREMRYDTARFS